MMWMLLLGAVKTYVLLVPPVRWEEAKVLCNHCGFSAATIQSEAVADVMDLVQAAGFQFAWIGEYEQHSYGSLQAALMRRRDDLAATEVIIRRGQGDDEHPVVCLQV